MSTDPTTPIEVFPKRATEVEPAFSRMLPIVSPKDLRERYLFGIKLKSSMTNQEITDDILQDFIIEAISEVEHELRIHISPVEFTDRYDYNVYDYSQWNFIILKNWPVVQIKAIKGKYPNAIDFLSFPTEWIALDNETGVFRLTPTTGQITQFFMTNEASFLPLILGARSRWPHLWEVTYVSGFMNDKVPAVINSLIGYNAAIRVLDQLGAVLFTANSYGIGIDGLSQSVSTPGPEYFAGHIERMRQKYDEMMIKVKAYYNRSVTMTAL